MSLFLQRPGASLTDLALPVNVKSAVFGALGDGTTDDTAAIHAARTAAGVGGRLYFPAGTYVAKNLQANLNSQVWELHPQAVIKLNPTNSGSDYLLRVTATSRVVIDGGQWDLTASTSTTALDLIYTTSCDDVTFRNMRVTAPASTVGVWYGIATHNVTRPRVLNNDLSNCTIMVQNSLSADLDNPVVTGNRVDCSGGTANSRAGIYVRTDTAGFWWKNARVNNNTVVGPAHAVNNNCQGIILWRTLNSTCNDNTSDGWCFGHSHPSSSGMTVVGNSVRRFCGFGIELPNVSGVTCTGNTLDGTLMASGGAGGGIAVEGADGDSVFMGANVFINFGAGTRCILTGSGGTQTRIGVVGNIFRITGAATYGWYVNGPLVNALFCDNIVHGDDSANQRAVYVAASGFDGFVFTGNLISNVESALRVTISSGSIASLLLTANRIKSVTNLWLAALSGTATNGGGNRVFGNGVPAVDELLLHTKSGAPADADYTSPVDGLTSLDTSAGKLWVRSGGSWIQPAVSGQYDLSLQTSGEEVISRLLLPPAGGATFSTSWTSGELRGTQFTARKSETVTQVRVMTGGTAAAATPSLCKIGVYSVAADGTHTLLASTASDTTLFAAANTGYTRTLTASFAKVQGQRYAVCVLVVSAAAMPSFVGMQNSTEWTVAPSLATRVTGQADVPSSVAPGSLLSNAAPIYAVLLP